MFEPSESTVRDTTALTAETPTAAVATAISATASKTISFLERRMRMTLLLVLGMEIDRTSLRRGGKRTLRRTYRAVNGRTGGVGRPCYGRRGRSRPIVTFGILGTIEAWEQGRRLPLGGAKQRALLAYLLLHRGEVVPSERLIDELWGGSPPATAAKSVQVYVSRLRHALGIGVLATQNRGYVLELEAGQLDLDRFEELASEGHRLLERGEPA